MSSHGLNVSRRCFERFVSDWWHWRLGLGIMRLVYNPAYSWLICQQCRIVLRGACKFGEARVCVWYFVQIGLFVDMAAIVDVEFYWNYFVYLMSLSATVANQMWVSHGQIRPCSELKSQVTLPDRVRYTRSGNTAMLGQVTLPCWVR